MGWIRVQFLTCTVIALMNNKASHKTWSWISPMLQRDALWIPASWLWLAVVTIGLCMCGRPPLRGSPCSGQRNTSGTCTHTWWCGSRGKCHSPARNTWPHSCRLRVKSGCTHARLYPLTLQEKRQTHSAQTWTMYSVVFEHTVIQRLFKRHFFILLMSIKHAVQAYHSRHLHSTIQHTSLYLSYLSS